MTNNDEPIKPVRKTWTMLKRANINTNELVKGYTKLESLYADGRQYIILDYYANQNTKVECKFKYNNNTTYPSNLFTSRTTSSSNMFGFYPYEGGSKKTRSTFGNENKDIAAIKTGTEYIVIRDGIYTYLNGELQATHTEQTFTATQPMYVLFQPDSTSTTLEAVIYYMKIWDNGILIYDLVPALQQSTGIAGLYNMVTNEFITSSGTQHFYPNYIMSGYNYVEDGLYANYVGYNSLSNKWANTVEDKKITMYNTPVYNQTTKSWFFNGGSKQYGTAPITAPADDFTIEVYGQIPDITNQTAIQAFFGGIWSYYAGYGIRGVYTTSANKLQSFITTATDKGVTVQEETDNIIKTNQKIKLIIRREKATGKYVITAINEAGQKIEQTSTQTTASIKANPANQFVIGTLKPTSTTTTDFGRGTYYAVRVYDKFLTDEEVLQNHKEDIRLYNQKYTDGYVASGLKSYFAGIDGLNVYNNWMDRINNYAFYPSNTSKLLTYNKDDKSFTNTSKYSYKGNIITNADGNFSIEIVTRNPHKAANPSSSSTYATIMGGELSSWSITKDSPVVIRTTDGNISFGLAENGTARIPITEFEDDKLYTFSIIPNVGLFINGNKVGDCGLPTTARGIGLFSHNNGYYDSYAATKTKVHAFRLYSRQLTANEVMKNHQEDIKLYGK